jgi:fibronectin type 3 domain-containing protein
MRGLLARFSLSLLAAALWTPLYAQNAATTVKVDAGTINVNSLPNGAIDPRIYGIGMIGSDCDADTANLTALNSPTHRWGGDLTSTFNWQTDSWNLSNDWYWELFTIGSGNGACLDDFISKTQAAGVGAEPIITVPMLPWISNSSSAAKYKMSYPVSVYGAQTGSDPYNANAGNGILASTGKDIVNNPSDDYVANTAAIQKAWIQHLVAKWGGATAANGVKYYMLDNEPDIWDGTHRDAHPDAPDYDEMWTDIQAYAGAIKQADPSAIVVGPEEAMWAWMWVSEKDMKGGTGAGSDYATHGNLYYYPWLLQQLAAYKKANGVSLIDILTVHCYDDVNSNPNQATRVLWDDTYTDPGGWFSDAGTGVVDYIPTMKNWVKAAFPKGDGPLIGCTEYSAFGGASDSTMTGATVEADALGIFGAYGFSLGNYWTLPAKPTYFALQIYRNYDGKNSTFGDTSVTDTVVQPDNLSSFAAVRKSDGALTVMVINKQTGTTPVTISLANFSNSGKAQAYQISSATQTSINSLGSVTISNHTISASLPGPSVTLYEIPAATAAPAAPTGLTAAGGYGQVTLNWTASTGATSYNIYRGTAASGESSTPLATGVNAVTYIDSTAANGQIYYYKVAAVNGKGSSGKSNEASATPSASDPLFTATATASPNPATQNASTTLTVKVTCTENSMTKGSVSIVVLDPGGNVAQTTPEASQSFTKGQTLTYSPAITPAAVGTYTVQVSVSGSSGQLWSEIPSAGTFTVNPAGPPAFTITGSVSPAKISATGSTSISATFKNTGGTLTDGNIEIQIFPTGGGDSIGGDAPNYNAWTIAGGASQTLSFTFTPPAGTASGTYNVVALAFSNSYATEYNQTTIGTLTIGSGGGTPTFTATASPSTSSVAIGGTDKVTVTVKDTGGALSNGIIAIYAVGAGKTADNAAGFAQCTSVNFTAGGTQSCQLAWTVPSSVAAGTYTLEIGVFNSSWSDDYYWNSNAGSITVTPDKPSAPTGLHAVAGNDAVALSWTASSGAASYNVYRGTTTGGESATPIVTKITGTSWTDKTATNGHTYYYKVAAVNTGGISSKSNEASAKLEPPAAITSPKPGATLTGSSATFAWTQISGATGYTLWVGSTGVGSANLDYKNTTTTTLTVKGLPVNGEKLYVRLKTNFDGAVVYNDYTFRATSPAALTSPKQGATFTGSSQTFTWAAVTGATGYTLWVGSTGVGSANLYYKNTTATTLTVKGLPVNGEKLYVRLKTNFDGVIAYNDYTFTALTKK